MARNNPTKADLVRQLTALQADYELLYDAHERALAEIAMLRVACEIPVIQGPVKRIDTPPPPWDQLDVLMDEGGEL